MSVKKKVLVCVTGGIAAYKVCDVVSKLVQADIDIYVAMTEEAQQLVGPTTFRALSGKPVATTLWLPPTEAPIPHINLPQSADLILVAPCTANMMAKMAHGIADELISTMLLVAAPKNILIAPAMNVEMWNHPATQRNVKTLQTDGVTLIGPADGWQACRTVGQGRMVESAEIVEAVKERVNK